MADVKFTCQCSKGHCEFHVDDEDVRPQDFIDEFNRMGCPGRVDPAFVVSCDEPDWKYDSKGVEIYHEDDDE